MRRNSKRGAGEGEEATGGAVRGGGVLLSSEQRQTDALEEDRSQALAATSEPETVSPALLVMFIQNILRQVSSDSVVLALYAMKNKCSPREYDLFVRAINGERTKGSIWPNGFM